MTNVVITGGSSGLGKLLCEKFSKLEGFKSFNFDLEDGNNLLDSRYCYGFADEVGEVDILINCAAINRIDYLEELDEQTWDLVMDTNAKGIYMMTKACLGALKDSKGTVLNIVSNASHMPMTSSLAYNASKGAAHIMTLQLARELTRRHGITVFGISPNKLAGTQMSEYIDNRVPEQRGWTKEQAKQYQINSLLAGEETDPETLAEFIVYLLSDKKRHKYLTGTILPYGA